MRSTMLTENQCNSSALDRLPPDIFIKNQSSLLTLDRLPLDLLHIIFDLIPYTQDLTALRLTCKSFTRLKFLNKKLFNTIIVRPNSQQLEHHKRSLALVYPLVERVVFRPGGNHSGLPDSSDNAFAISNQPQVTELLRLTHNARFFAIWKPNHGSTMLIDGVDLLNLALKGMEDAALAPNVLDINYYYTSRIWEGREYCLDRLDLSRLYKLNYQPRASGTSSFGKDTSILLRFILSKCTRSLGWLRLDVMEDLAPWCEDSPLVPPLHNLRFLDMCSVKIDNFCLFSDWLKHSLKLERFRWSSFQDTRSVSEKNRCSLPSMPCLRALELNGVDTTSIWGFTDWLRAKCPVLSWLKMKDTQGDLDMPLESSRPWFEALREHPKLQRVILVDFHIRSSYGTDVDLNLNIAWAKRDEAQLYISDDNNVVRGLKLFIAGKTEWQPEAWQVGGTYVPSDSEHDEDDEDDDDNDVDDD